MQFNVKRWTNVQINKLIKNIQTIKLTDRHSNKQTDRQKEGQIKFANFDTDAMKKMVHCAK